MSTTAALIIDTRTYTMRYNAQEEGERQRITDAARTLMRRLDAPHARISYDITSGIVLDISTDPTEQE